MILARVEVTSTETIPREEVYIDVPPDDFRKLNVEGNRIYIAGDKVYVYDGVFSHLLAAIKNGTLEKTEYLKFFGCPGWASGNFYKVEVVKGGEELLNLNSAGPVCIHREEMLKKEHIKPERGLIRIFRSSGKLLRSVELKVPGLVSIDFLGEDEKGNFYIQVEKERGEGIELEVYKFDAAGNHLATLNIPDTKGSISFWSDRLLLVGKDGAIWQVAPTNGGWCVNKWNI